MKREIIFRGKCKSSGRWFYGCYVAFNCISTIDGEVIVLPETVGQFTGLTDRNGTRIFEGDIIYMGLYPYVIKYDRENARYMLYTLRGNNKRDGFNAFTMETHEVIGNIHDNPELLEEREAEK